MFYFQRRVHKNLTFYFYFFKSLFSPLSRLQLKNFLKYIFYNFSRVFDKRQYLIYQYLIKRVIFDVISVIFKRDVKFVKLQFLSARIINASAISRIKKNDKKKENNDNKIENEITFIKNDKKKKKKNSIF